MAAGMFWDVGWSLVLRFRVRPVGANRPFRGLRSSSMYSAMQGKLFARLLALYSL
jgi:hypothetical protein